MSIEKEYTEEDVIIIFGGAGFIGTHLINQLRNQSNNILEDPRIIIIDKQPRESINKKLENYSKISYYQFDLANDNYNDLDFLNVFYQKENGNNISIFQLASNLGPSKVQVETSEDDFKINFNIYNYLKSIIEKDNLIFKKIIFASTSEVYGNMETMDEDGIVTIDPHSEGFRPQYALQKLTAENLFINLGKSLNQDVVVTRLFNIVGKDQDAGFVVSNFSRIFKDNIDIFSKEFEMYNSLENNEEQEQFSFKKYSIYGDGKQERVFIDVDETAEILKFLINFPKDERITNNIINIANIKNNISIEKLALKYISLFKSTLKTVLETTDIENNRAKEYIVQLIEKLDKNPKDFITYEDGPIGQIKRFPLVFKLYKILQIKPQVNINQIVANSCK